MPKRIYLARHGETDFNKNNIIQGRRINAPLNDAGSHQSRLLAGALKPCGTFEIHCSSLIRTSQTAEPLAKMGNFPVFAHSGLDELDYGDLEGTSALDENTAFHDLRNKWESGEIHHAPPNGESPFDVLMRADQTCQKLIHDSKKDHILFVVHGRLIRILTSHWLGIGLEKMHQVPHANAAYNVLDFHNEQFSAVELHVTRHLDFGSTKYLL